MLLVDLIDDFDLIRHRKLTIVLIPVGKGEGDGVISRVRDYRSASHSVFFHANAYSFTTLSE